MIRTAIHAGVWSASPEPDSVRRVLDAAATVGFDCIALPLRQPAAIRAEAVGAAFRASGVGALGTAGLPRGSDIGSNDSDERRRGESHLLTVIALARDIGITQINGVLYGPLGHAPAPATGDDMRRSAEVMFRVAEAAGKAGVALCVELVNRYETSMLNTVDQALNYLAMVNHPNLRLHLDTYHMAIEEADPVAAATAALPHLGYFELDQSHRGRLDQGSLDLAAISAPVRDGGYRGLVGVEAFARGNLAADHADSLAVWRDHFDDADALARHAIELIGQLFEADNATSHEGRSDTI